MTGPEATAFVVALREFRRACAVISVTPLVIGFNSSADLHKVESAAEIAGAKYGPVVGGVHIDGMDCKRAWGR